MTPQVHCCYWHFIHKCFFCQKHLLINRFKQLNSILYFIVYMKYIITIRGFMLNIKHNLCAIDRIIRGIIAVALIVYVVVFFDQIGDMLLQISILIFALMNLISFVLGWCPVYNIANINTCKKG